MSRALEQILREAAEKHGPPPASFAFGDGLDWNSPLDPVMLYVELPFWLMVPPGPVELESSGTTFTVHICPQWMEIFAGEILDSRRTVVDQRPWKPDYAPSGTLADALEAHGVQWLERDCKTVLRLEVRAHRDAFRELGEADPPRAKGEQEAYSASLCEAHIPVLNELVQRYRLITYDYFAYEVSAWDVPVWYLKHDDIGFRAVLLPYKEWDVKPITVEDSEDPAQPPVHKPFEFATPSDLAAASSRDGSHGEFDLLDARSLMERGDYTGAVRRTVTAIEAILRSALYDELANRYAPADAEARTAKTDNDFPGRLRQWRKLAKPPISQQEFDEFETTRAIRHEIVHRGRRLLHDERGRAQRAVDTGRWLYNKIEGKPDRAKLRDYGTLKSVGRAALAVRFPSTVKADGIVLGPLFPAPAPEQSGGEDEQ